LNLFIGVGSNIAPEENIPSALERLARWPDISVTRVSRFYRCSPLGRTVGDAEFLNGIFACDVDAALDPRALKFDVLRSIEAALGRSTGRRSGPRTIDLDIVAHGDAIVEEPDLHLPDPDWLVRPFIAIPMAEIAPDLVHPIVGRTAAEIAREVGRDGLRLNAAFSDRLWRRLADQWG
jgi:2-amino-4-hydroxy-6-hydroxymethyldihydropteridine diphosphokinase